MKEKNVAFEANIISWEYCETVCRRIRDDLRDDGYSADVIVGIARGGLFPAQCLADLLGVGAVKTLDVRHPPDGDARIEGGLSRSEVSDRRVLVVDDAVDSGATLTRAREHVEERGPASLRTVALHAMEDVRVRPDYVGEYGRFWRLNVYPWCFTERMVELTSFVTAKDGTERFDVDDLFVLLETYVNVSRIDVETVHPHRIRDVLAEMVDRGLLAPCGSDEWRLTDDGKARAESWSYFDESASD